MTHCSTVLAQVLRLVPRHDFERLAAAHHSGAPLRRMSRWKQFVALASGQLAGRQTLRDTVTMLAAQGPRLYHLGSGPTPRSSLARVNAEQPHSFYEALFAKLAEACQKAAPGHRFRFKGKLFSCDASLIELSLALFPWARFANAKAALKLNIALDHAGLVPAFANLSPPHASEAEFVRALRLPKGSLCVFDKGCLSFALPVLGPA